MFVFIAVQWLTRKTQYLMYEYHIQVFSLNNKDALTAVYQIFLNYYYLCVQYLYLSLLQHVETFTYTDRHLNTRAEIC